MVNRAAAKLRAQLADKDSIIVCPGVQDGLSARVCLDEGFRNLYMVSPFFLPHEPPRPTGNRPTDPIKPYPARPAQVQR